MARGDRAGPLTCDAARAVAAAVLCAAVCAMVVFPCSVYADNQADGVRDRTDSVTPPPTQYAQHATAAQGAAAASPPPQPQAGQGVPPCPVYNTRTVELSVAAPVSPVAEDVLAVVDTATAAACEHLAAGSLECAAVREQVHTQVASAMAAGQHGTNAPRVRVSASVDRTVPVTVILDFAADGSSSAPPPPGSDTREVTVRVGPQDTDASVEELCVRMGLQPRGPACAPLRAVAAKSIGVARYRHWLRCVRRTGAQVETGHGPDHMSQCVEVPSEAHTVTASAVAHDAEVGGRLHSVTVMPVLRMSMGRGGTGKLLCAVVTVRLRPKRRHDTTPALRKPNAHANVAVDCHRCSWARTRQAAEGEPAASCARRACTFLLGSWRGHCEAEVRATPSPRPQWPVSRLSRRGCTSVRSSPS